MNGWLTIHKDAMDVCISILSPASLPISVVISFFGITFNHLMLNIVLYWNLGLHLLFSSKCFLLSFWLHINNLTVCLWNFKMCLCLRAIVLLSISNFIVFWSEECGCYNRVLWHLLTLVLWPRTWLVFMSMPCILFVHWVEFSFHGH